MSVKHEWVQATDAQALNAAVLADVSAVIVAAVQARGHALVAFPGGSTPLPILESLSRAALPWDKVTVIPSDDRLVPRISPLSNAAVLEKLFAARGARVLGFGEDSAQHERCGRETDALLHALTWPPDLVWLGMGGDGHTASIFAGPDLERALSPEDGARAVGVRPDPLPPEAPVNRVTLTAPAIAAARRVIVVIAGAGKRRILEQAIAEAGSSSFPIGRVLETLTAPATLYCHQ